MSSGSVSTSRPSPPGNSRAKVESKAVLTSAYASVKTCSTRWSTSRTMSRRSLRVLRRSSSCSVRNLCRSSIAENSSSASGLTRPSSRSARSAVRSRFCCSSRTYGAGSGCSSPSSTSPLNGHQLVGAVVGDQPVGVQPELLERPLLELLDAHLLLGAGHLVAVHGVDQLVVLLAEVAQRGADVEQLLLAAGAGLLDRGAGLGGPVDRDLEPAEHVADRAGRPPRRRGPRGAAARGARRRGRGPRARRWRRGPASRRGRAAPGPAPPRCAARAGRPSRPGGRPGRASTSRSRTAGVGLLVGGVLGGREPGLEVGEPGDRLVAGLLGLLDRLGRAARPRRGRRGPGSRTGRAPRRPRPGWRRTRAAWRARRRRASAPRAARSPGGTCRSRAARRRRRPRRAARRPRRPRPGSRSGSAGWSSRRRRSGRRAGRRRGSPR